nr:EOG090X021B [Cyclestheria hislopi]
MVELDLSDNMAIQRIRTEQRSLIVSLLENSLLGDKPPGLWGIDSKKVKIEAKPVATPNMNVEEGRKRLTALLEKIEGCASVVEVSSRTLLHEGDMVELDLSDNMAIQRIRGYLLNDSFMIATWLPNRRGPMRYQYQALYELDSLAVINIRDLGPVKDAFKLMMFPDTRVLQCANANDKKQWLEAFDAAKKARMTKDSGVPSWQKVEVNNEQQDDSNNPFAEDESLPHISHQTTGTEIDVLPEWLLEVADDLDVYVAQRDFEEAVTLVEKIRTFWNSASPTFANLHRDLKLKIDGRIRHLRDVLTNELRVTPDKSLQGGPRAACRAVMLLVRLGQAPQACELFLKHRTALLKHNLKQLKTEGATTLYITRIAGLFFPFVADTGREILRAFSNNRVCASAYVVWARNEVHKFCNNFKKHVFAPQSTLSTVADCVSFVRKHCEQLINIGLDLTYYLEGELRGPVERGLRDAREKLIESVKLRAIEDKWKPTNFGNKSAVQRFADDMSEIGITSIQSWVYDDCCVLLTSNTINFTKAFLSLLEDAMKLSTNDNNFLIDEILYDIFQAQLKHVENSSRSGKYAAEANFINKNAGFLLNTVLTLAEQQVEKTRGRPCLLLGKLRSDYEGITKFEMTNKKSHPNPTYI